MYPAIRTYFLGNMIRSLGITGITYYGCVAGL